MTRRTTLDRRRFLELTAGASLGLSGLIGSACGTAGRGAAAASGPGPAAAADVDPALDAILVPKINDAVTVHPVRRLDFDPNENIHDPLIIPELIALQLRQVYELGFDGIRVGVPLSDRPGIVAAIPYVRAARALGIDALVLLTESTGGFAMPQALWSGKQRPPVLALYERLFARPPQPAAPKAGGLGPGGVGRIAFQILNEPALFFGLPPDVYVREILVPCTAEIRRINSQIIVVSAAEVGTVDGPDRVRALLEAGVESACDRVAYHIYEREIIDRLPPHIKAVIWVTETGTTGTAAHLPWVRDVYPQIRNTLVDVTRLFYYDLFDKEVGNHRLIDIAATPEGYQVVPESADLCDFFRQNVAVRAAGHPLVPFDTLIPDIRAYFATPEDLAAIDAVLQD